MSRLIPDNPAISRAERNGYEPWLYWGYNSEEEWIASMEDEEEEDDSDVYYGSETDSF